MFDDLKIRNKLILLLAGPIVIILLLSALGARDRQQSADDSRNVEAMVSVSKSNSDIVDALQQESIFSSAYLGSDRSDWVKEVETARSNTDAVLALGLPALTDGVGGSTSVESAARLAVDAADKLSYYRGSVDQGFRPDQINELVTSYSDLGNTFLAVNTNISDDLSDPDAAVQLRSAAALGAYKATLAEQAALVSGASAQGSFGTDVAVADLEAAVTAEAQQLALLQSITGLGQKGSVRDAMSADASIAFKDLSQLVAGSTADSAVNLDPTAVVDAGSNMIQSLHEVESEEFQQLIDASQSALSSAERAANLFLFAAVIAIAGAAIAAVVLGRRITRPLAHLTDAAENLSTEQMPRLIESLKNPAEDELGYQLGAMKPIDIDSDDEIGHLARAFNEVQRVAGEVANEQAKLLRKGIGEMFVNLARRNQALLDRQIEFIDELERGEEDPDQLENLYRLDHLATRMRRNAESLLVLAGAEPPRRRGRPAPLANVVRAALAEVEDFGRIELLSFDEVLVASNAAADLAHLLSELMENATNFSPPETRVEVVGHKTKADGYVISVTDHGIGMSGAQIDDANTSLAKPPLVGLAMSRSLGFIVVGRLATRHGIAVRMMTSAAGGVTAVVSIPPSLVVDTPGGLAEPESAPVAPARLKPVLDSPTSGLGPLSFTPNGSSNDAEAPAPETRELSPSAADEPATWTPTEPATDAGLPKRSIFDTGPATPVEPSEADLAAQVDEAVEPAMPAALSFAAPDADESVPSEPTSSPEPSGASARLDGPPPPAPLVARPFFFDDAEPPRPFGAYSAPEAAPSAEPAEAPAAPRLFGGPAPSTDAPAAPTAPSAPEPPLAPSAPPAPTAEPVAADGPPALASRRPMATRTPGASGISGANAPMAPAPTAPEPAATPEPEPTSEPAAPAAAATTTSGLAKRVPRSAGAKRVIPGAEGERGVSATRRSPEEIRKMLSQHSAGRQRARTQEPVPAGPSEENESND